VLSVRPKVAELAYHVYGRPLHPELFEVHASRTIERDCYSLQVDITTSGHVIRFSSDPWVLTEVAASAQHPLPQRRCLAESNLRKTHRESLNYRESIVYDTQFSVDSIPSTMFMHLQEEVQQFGTENAIFHGFDSSGRIALGGFSFIHLQCRAQSVQLKSVHTFPDDQIVVKSISSFLIQEQ
jgi:hypothetical protein